MKPDKQGPQTTTKFPRSPTGLGVPNAQALLLHEPDSTFLSLKLRGILPRDSGILPGRSDQFLRQCALTMDLVCLLVV